MHGAGGEQVIDDGLGGVGWQRRIVEGRKALVPAPSRGLPLAVLLLVTWGDAALGAEAWMLSMMLVKTTS